MCCESGYHARSAGSCEILAAARAYGRHGAVMQMRLSCFLSSASLVGHLQLLGDVAFERRVELHGVAVGLVPVAVLVAERVVGSSPPVRLPGACSRRRCPCTCRASGRSVRRGVCAVARLDLVRRVEQQEQVGPALLVAFGGRALAHAAAGGAKVGRGFGGRLRRRSASRVGSTYGAAAPACRSRRAAAAAWRRRPSIRRARRRLPARAASSATGR